MEELPNQSNTQEEKPKGRMVCAWCKKDSGPATTEQDTHGICKECAIKAGEELDNIPEEPAPESNS